MARLCFILALVLTLGLALSVGATPTTSGNNNADVEEVKRSKTGISWKITPDHVLVYLDGKKLGEAGKLSFTKTRPGKHTIRLTKGGDEEELEVKIVKGQVLRMVYTFDAG